MPSRDTLLSKLRRHAGRSAVFGTLLSMAFSAAAEEVDFATAENGPAPAAFDTRMRTGGGRPGRWEVVSDNTAKGSKALAQLSADPTDLRFPLAIYLRRRRRCRGDPASSRSRARRIRRVASWCGCRTLRTTM